MMFYPPLSRYYFVINMLIFIHSHTHTHIHIDTQTQIDADTHNHTHTTHTFTHTHTHTLTHTHALIFFHDYLQRGFVLAIGCFDVIRRISACEARSRLLGVSHEPCVRYGQQHREVCVCPLSVYCVCDWHVTICTLLLLSL